MPDPGQHEFTVGCKGCSGVNYYHNAECRRKNGGDLTTMMRKAMEETPTKDKHPRQADEDAPQALGSSSSLPVFPATALPPTQHFSIATPTKQVVEATPAAMDTATPERHGAKRTAETFPNTLEGKADTKQPREVSAVEIFPHVTAEECGGAWCEDTGAWIEAADVAEGINREMDLLEELDTAEENLKEEVPPGTKVWSSRWCHRVRSKKCRSRFVVRQFNPAKGKVGGDEFFAPTPGGEIGRILFALASMWGLGLAVLDFSVAFMHTPLKKPEWIEPPPHAQRAGSPIVWKLRKALNGLRVSAKAFCDYLFDVLTDMGWKRSRLQPNLFLGPVGSKLALTHHIDDALVMGIVSEIASFVAELGKRIKVKMWKLIAADSITEYVGGAYWRTADGGVLETPLPGYIAGIGSLLGLDRCKAVVTPGVRRPEDEKLTEEEKRVLDEEETTLLRQVVGKVQYQVRRRPEVSYSLKEVSRKQSAAQVYDLGAAKRIVRYLLSHRDLGLYHHTAAGEEFVEVWCDSDWAGCRETRHSTSSWYVYLGNTLIISNCKTQPRIALSSCEAEFVAMSLAMGDGKYVQELLRELGLTLGLRVHCDASSALQSASRPGMGRLRHIEVRHLWIQEEISSGRVVAVKEKGTENLADVGTKFLEGPAFITCRSALGVRALSVAVITQLSGCMWAPGGGHQQNDLFTPTMVLMVFLVGLLLGTFISSARGRSTSAVAQVSIESKAVATRPLDARATAATDLPVEGVWVSVAGERWHRDRDCRGLCGARGVHRVTPCSFCARLG